MIIFITPLLPTCKYKHCLLCSLFMLETLVLKITWSLILQYLVGAGQLNCSSQFIYIANETPALSLLFHPQGLQLTSILTCSNPTLSPAAERHFCNLFPYESIIYFVLQKTQSEILTSWGSVPVAYSVLTTA